MQKKYNHPPLFARLKELSEDPAFDNLPPHTRCHVNSPLPEKQTFSNFEECAYQLCDKAYLNKFASTKIKTNKKLILFTWVIPSGLGDLSMQIYLSDLIKKAQPHLDIELISLIETHSPIPPGLKSSLPHHIIRYDHPTAAKLSAKMIQLLRNAFSIIEIPTAYFDFINLKQAILKNNPRPPIISRIGQYGFIDTEDYNPSTYERSMGLYFLEKGVVILDPIKPLSRDLNRYFAYLITKSGIQTFLETILIQRAKDDHDLTLIIPNLGKVIPLLETIPFDKYGIKDIHLIDGDESSHIILGTEGKTFTLIHEKDLTQSKIRDYLSTSNSFVGIRGDGSFTEAISTDALFFYDALDHALPFLLDLKRIAETFLLPYFSLCQFLDLLLKTKEDPSRRAKQIAELLEDPSLFVGLKKLKTIIREKYTFNPVINNLIKQNWAFYENSSLQKEKKEVFSRCLENPLLLKSYFES